MNEHVISVQHVHFEPILVLKSVPHVPQIGHESAGAGYERLTKFGPDFGYTHSVFQFTLAGKGYFSSNQGTFELTPGTGFLCSYRDPDVRYWAAETSNKTPWEFVFVNFDGGNSHEVVMELIEKFGPVYTLPEQLPLIRSLLQMTNGSVATRTALPMESAALVYNMLAILIESKTLYAVPEMHFLISEVYKLISQPSNQYMSVKELSARLNVSREHLTRVFTRCLGKTPHECIVIEKIKQACHLLKTTNKTNDEIASALGYVTTARLVQHFKGLLEISPREYRQALLCGNDIAYRLFYKENNRPA